MNLTTNQSIWMMTERTKWSDDQLEKAYLTGSMKLLCEWTNYWSTLLNESLNEIMNAGVGLVMTEGIDDVTQGETKLALFEEVSVLCFHHYLCFSTHRSSLLFKPVKHLRRAVE